MNRSEVFSATASVVAAIAATIAAIPVVVKFILYLRKFPEMPVDHDLAKHMKLEEYSKERGYRLFWGSMRSLEQHLRFEGCKRIIWEDESGKRWLLGPANKGETVALWKKL